MNDPDDTDRIVLPVPAPPRRWPHLMVISGPGIGQVFRLVRPQTIIGRAAEADVCLPAGTVSRRHAVVSVLGDRLIIEDLRSSNGTFVGVDKIKQPRELADGTLITVGDITLLKLTYAVATDEAVRQAAYKNASRDPATQASNTWHFLDRLRSEHAYARRHKTPLALVFICVDDLPAPLNEPGDDLALDDLMRSIAVIVRETIRIEDGLARSARSELLVLVRADQASATAMAERVRFRVCDVGAEQGATWRVTVSVAVIPLSPSSILAPETILVTAGVSARQALSEATNRVVVLPLLEAAELSAADRSANQEHE